MTPQFRKYLTEIKRAVESVAPDAEVTLFGSRARGDARPGSDIDLLVLVNREQLSCDDKMDINLPLYKLELQWEIPINAIIHTRKQWYDRPFRTPFFMNVMNEGIRL